VTLGHFIAGVAALVWTPIGQRYLLLRRAWDKDFSPGVWECVTGRVHQGEGFEDALRREVREELGVEVQVDFIIGTTHFYRGDERPENELLGVVYACSLEDPEAIRLSAEHAEYRWVTTHEAAALLTDPAPRTQWILRVIVRAEALRRLAPPALLAYGRQHGFEVG